MTRAEHRKAYRAARSANARQVIEGKKKIRAEYIRVIAGIAKVVRNNRHKPFLEEQIRAAFPRKELFDRLKSLVLNGRADTARLIAGIEKKYLLDALDKVPGHGISKDKITDMFNTKVERTKIANSIPYADAIKNAKRKSYTGTGFAYTPEGEWKTTRVDYTFGQSHSLSKSMWDTVNDNEEKILNVVWGSISQGRDVRTVAADLMKYAKAGPKVLPGRWGKLEPGTREYVKRFGTAGIDYRAMRLYRSEKYRHMQEAAVEDGESNPACTGEYDWILMPGRENWNCDCPEIAAAGPYKKDNIPPYRHPNCDCMIEPRLKDDDEFIQQLRDYVNGADTPGAHEIEEWALENDLKENGIKSTGFDWDQELTSAVSRGANSEAEARRIGELAFAKAQREDRAVIDVIKQFVPLGEDKPHIFSADSNNGAIDWVNHAMQYYPTKWLNASAAMSHKKPMTVKHGNLNGYNPKHKLLFITKSGKKSLHELAHRIAHAVPEIRKLEAEFYERRTSGEEKLKLSLFQKYKSNEMAKDIYIRIDKFKDPYMGVDYGDNWYELFSMGVESLWFNTYDIDKEMLDFIVGVLLGV